MFRGSGFNGMCPHFFHCGYGSRRDRLHAAENPGQRHYPWTDVDPSGIGCRGNARSDRVSIGTMLSLFMFLRLLGAVARWLEHLSTSSRLVVGTIHELPGFENWFILNKSQYLSDSLGHIIHIRLIFSWRLRNASKCIPEKFLAT